MNIIRNKNFEDDVKYYTKKKKFHRLAREFSRLYRQRDESRIDIYAM